MRFFLAALVLWSGLAFSVEPNRTDAIHVSNDNMAEARAFSAQVERGQLKEKTNVALDAMVRFAAWKLNQKGHPKESKRLLSEWEGRWSVVLLSRDLGDHRPMSKWLADKYAMLEFTLGKDLCHMLRLDDIKTVNYALPVVFKCVDNVDEREYSKHFIPLCGVVAYWGSLAACTGLTFGTGFFFCGPIAMSVEWLTENVFAPKINGSAWKRACRPGREDGLVLPEFIPMYQTDRSVSDSYEIDYQ